MGYNLPFPSFFSQHIVYLRKFKLRQIKILYIYDIFWNFQCQYLKEITEETAEEDELPSKKSRSLCSSFKQPSVLARSKYVLPHICILCQREKNSCVQTQGRSKGPLVYCSTSDAVQLNHLWMWSRGWQRRTQWNSNRSPTESYVTG